VRPPDPCHLSPRRPRRAGRSQAEARRAATRRDKTRRDPARPGPRSKNLVAQIRRLVPADGIDPKAQIVAIRFNVANRREADVADRGLGLLGTESGLGTLASIAMAGGPKKMLLIVGRLTRLRLWRDVSGALSSQLQRVWESRPPSSSSGRRGSPILLDV
jgi:hypothetical protein